MPNLYDRINRANDKAASMDARLGHPNRRNLLIRHLSLNASYQSVTEDTLITPSPLITTPSPQLIGLVIGNDQQGVTVSANDYLAEVSRSIPYSMFVREDGRRVKAFIDPVMINGLMTSGNEVSIIHIDDRDCCFWKLILRKIKDK